jgi:hypothetical protein
MISFDFKKLVSLSIYSRRSYLMFLARIKDVSLEDYCLKFVSFSVLREPSAAWGTYLFTVEPFRSKTEIKCLAETEAFVFAIKIMFTDALPSILTS